MAKKIAPKERIIKIENRDILCFYGKEYMDYAKYTIANRAIPSIIDGLKPGARKIMHAAFYALPPGKKKKFFDVVGAAYSRSQYHHGDSSLISTMMTLASPYKDNLAPLEIVGSGGDLRNQEAAAPRYLEIKLSQFASLLQKDKHILEYNYDGEIKVEPKYYLPLLPLVLTYRSTGIAVGYKFCSPTSYNPLDLVEQCIQVIKNGKLSKKLTPHIIGFDGVYEEVDVDTTLARGRFEVKRDHIIVTELPPSQTFDKFENNLIKLLEKDKIKNWENESKDNDIQYKIFVNPTTLAKQVESGRHLSIYNLAEKISKPNYVLLDEHDKIIQFNKPEEVLKYFVQFRLETYKKLKQYNIDSLNERIEKTNSILKFLDLYFADKIKLGKNVTMAKAQEQIAKHNLPAFVLDIKFSRMTKEEYAKLLAEKKELEDELKVIVKTPTEELYLRELNDMIPAMKKSFPRQEFITLKK